MKIVFICGSAQPGKDGVGDYVRLLAVSLIKMGHQAAIVAYNDKFVSAPETVVQDANAYSISVLRLPANFSAAQKLRDADNFINAFSPDWISLQFVPFSFNPKGIPFSLPFIITRLSKEIKCHIMFHELWVDAVDVKSKVLKYLQKFIIKNLVRRVTPRLVHTSVPIYKKRLEALGVITKPLPLFSNVVTSNSNITNNNGKFTVGIFGQITYMTELEHFFLDAKQYCEINHLSLSIVLIGGSAQRAQQFVGEIKDEEIKEVLQHTGFLDESDISSAIMSCDIGLTPVPYHLLGKSGSTLAFLNHGIPVAAPFTKRGFETEPIGFFDETLADAIGRNFEELFDKDSFKLAGLLRDKISSSNTAEVFIRDLEKVN